MHAAAAISRDHHSLLTNEIVVFQLDLVVIGIRVGGGGGGWFKGQLESGLSTECLAIGCGDGTGDVGLVRRGFDCV